MNPLIPGFALIIVAAVCGGAFALPIRIRRRFELENLYVIAACVTMLILPYIAARLWLPHWQMAIAAAGGGTIIRGLAYGFAWGLGAITFGYGVNAVGLSIGYAVIMGINTAVGSLLPFLAQSPDYLFKPAGLVILAGIAGCIVGVAVCGRAGQLREHLAVLAANAVGGAAEPPRPQPAETSRMRLGLLLCILSGVLSACANLGFAFTARAGAEAVKLGANPVIASLDSWMLVYWGGVIATLLWFGGLQLKRGTWRNNFGPGAGHDFGLAIGMGVLWFLAMIPYGMGAYYLGHLGTSVGWAINIAASLILANGLGFLTGEWKRAPRRSRAVLYWGLIVLLAAMATLGAGNALASRLG